MNDSTDRRVRRTKSQLHRALIELMLEHGYDRITVRDILQRADVGRSTFYAHFRDKDDLLLVSSTEYLRAAVAACRTGRDTAPLAPVFTLFRLAAENPEVYEAMLGRNSSAVLLHATRRMVAAILTEQLSKRLDMDEKELTTTVTFMSWGVTGLLGAIADTETPLSATEAYQRFEQLIGPGLVGRVRVVAPADDSKVTALASVPVLRSLGSLDQ
ncbi:TetR/AcrR family transcriptional regulator [Nocardia sp. KC 131]|uniref:TetR/AcrR family transcriptional regulator n=1 Tax=Nocardia arseniciresistens TaxID=3392119 RepID=UPI00398E668C